MKDFIARLIVFAVRIIESKPKTQSKHVYGNISYVYDRHHEDWNDYLRDTGL